MEHDGRVAARLERPDEDNLQADGFAVLGERRRCTDVLADSDYSAAVAVGNADQPAVVAGGFAAGRRIAAASASAPAAATGAQHEQYEGNACQREDS